MLMTYFLAPTVFIERGFKQMGLAPEKIAVESEKMAIEAADAFVQVAAKHEKPVVGFTYRSLKESFTRHLITNGIPVFPDPKRASRALRALLDYKAMKDRVPDVRGAEKRTERTRANLCVLPERR